LQSLEQYACSVKIVELDGHKYLDGGTANPIPFEWAIENGYEKIVLVLTRDIDYRKKPLSGMLKRFMRKNNRNIPSF
jgi:predicted patatin/cPLA2 family phospholipase